MTSNYFFSSVGDVGVFPPSSLDVYLVMISILIGIVASIFALYIVSIAKRSKDTSIREIAAATGAVAFGLGVWAMHFVGMLALRLCVDVSYDLFITGASVIPALFAAYAAIKLLLNEHISNKQLVLSGTLVGLGVGAMHYAGMFAMIMTPEVRFQFSWFALSLVVAIGLGITALWISYSNIVIRASNWQRLLASGFILGLAIAGMHYVAMISVVFIGTPTSNVPIAPIHTYELTMAIVLAVIIAFFSVGGINILNRFRMLLRTSNAAQAELSATVYKLKRSEEMLEERIRLRTNELEIAINEAQAASHIKSQFLAVMSHEIRTPMNGVIGMVDILQQTQLDTAQRKMLSTIQQSSMVLLQILNDILDLSKIEAGKLSVERIPTHLRDLLDSVVQLMLATSNFKSIALTLFVSPALPHRIVTDPTRLRQVMLNLVGNAIKFTSGQIGKSAKVMLFVEPCTLAHGEAGVKFRVIDTGIGIAPEILGKLFQPFTQADEGTARKFGGTGLGLSISQRLVELIGGHISVRSELGEGSEFCVELPLEVAPLLPHSSTQVLAVIDDEALSNIVRSYALSANATMTILPSLEAVRQHLQNMPPPIETAVVVLGLKSFMTPLELQLPAEVGVVQLLLDSHKMVATPDVLSASPLLYSDLIRAIAHASDRFNVVKTAEVTPSLDVTTRLAPSSEQALSNGQLVLLAEDNETNREVIQEQLRLLGYACEVAVDGLEALSMWRTGRYALLLTDCHMPHMDGFELSEAIRKAEPAGTRLPIVAITANAMQGEAERCKARGMDDYLSKPLRMVALAPMLDKWLPLAEKQSQAKLPTLDLDVPVLADSPLAELPAWDASTLVQLVGDNPIMHRRWLGKFVISAEKQTVMILDALAAGEFNAVADEAHALKSAARMVGALRFGELCEGLETAGSAGDGPACIAHGQQLEPALAVVKACIASHLEGMAS